MPKYSFIGQVFDATGREATRIYGDGDPVALDGAQFEVAGASIQNLAQRGADIADFLSASDPRPIRIPLEYATVPIDDGTGVERREVDMTERFNALANQRFNFRMQFWNWNVDNADLEGTANLDNVLVYDPPPRIGFSDGPFFYLDSDAIRADDVVKARANYADRPITQLEFVFSFVEDGQLVPLLPSVRDFTAGRKLWYDFADSGRAFQSLTLPGELDSSEPLFSASIVTAFRSDVIPQESRMRLQGRLGFYTVQSVQREGRDAMVIDLQAEGTF